MADLVQWLRAQLDEDERIARAACKYASPEWHLDDEFGETVLWWPPEFHTPYEQDKHWRGQALDGHLAPHIAEHDPARVLREVQAKRGLLADVLAEPHFRNEEDNWYTCAALTDEDGDPVCLDESRAPGPCDCGRDARVARRVRLLALPFEDRPGFAEAIASAE